MSEGSKTMGDILGSTMQRLIDDMTVVTASGEALDRLAAVFGGTRRLATPAQVHDVVLGGKRGRRGWKTSPQREGHESATFADGLGGSAKVYRRRGRRCWSVDVVCYGGMTRPDAFARRCDAKRWAEAEVERRRLGRERRRARGASSFYDPIAEVVPDSPHLRAAMRRGDLVGIARTSGRRGDLIEVDLLPVGAGSFALGPVHDPRLATAHKGDDA